MGGGAGGVGGGEGGGGGGGLGGEGGGGDGCTYGAEVSGSCCAKVSSTSMRAMVRLSIAQKIR